MEDYTRAYPGGYQVLPQEDEPDAYGAEPLSYGEEIEDADTYGDGEAYPEPMDYEIYEEDGGADGHRFHFAMGVFDTASILAGVVVIFLLTAIVITLVSWLQGDLSHMLAVFQSTVQ